MQQVADAAARFHSVLGVWPTSAELSVAEPAVKRVDLWQREFRHEVGARGVVVRTAGVDGAFDTTDDLVSEPGRAEDGMVCRSCGLGDTDR